MTEEYYNRFWKDEKNIYDSSEPNIVRDAEKAIKKLFTLIPKPKKILDAGCGLGINTYFLSKKAKTIGIDLVEEPLKLARKRCPNIEFVKTDITHTLFPSSEFDMIFSSQVIEHILDTESMFNEFNRLLKKNGYLVLLYPDYNFLKRLYITLFYWDKIFYPTNPHIRFYTKNTIKDILTKHGFRIIHYEPVIKIFGSISRASRIGIPSVILMIAKKMK